MAIHQMQLRYEPTADRLLWQLRTQSGEVFAIWLTRRMVSRLWPPLQQLVMRSDMATVTPRATVHPDAHEMLARAARERPLSGADFSQRFDANAATLPLGAEPMLPTSIEMGPGAAGTGVTFKLKDAGGRGLDLKLNGDLSTALMRLVEQALIPSEWGLAMPAAPVQAPAVTVPPSALN